jgi:hypothetical protein
LGKNSHPSNLWSAGLLAISLIILQDLFSISSFDRPAYTSLFAFAVAIPILACNLVINFTRRETGEKAGGLEILFYIVGVLAAIVGVAAAFWHACWIAAIVFLSSSLVAFLVFLKLWLGYR